MAIGEKVNPYVVKIYMRDGTITSYDLEVPRMETVSGRVDFTGGWLRIFRGGPSIDAYPADLISRVEVREWSDGDR